MKLDAATYHDIINLTTNVAVSPAEAEAWKKCLLATADEKIKMQRSQLTVMLGDPRVEGCKTHGQGKSRGRRGWIFQSLPSLGGARTFSHHYQGRLFHR